MPVPGPAPGAVVALLTLLRRFEQAVTAAAFAIMVAVLGWDIFGRELMGGGKIWATPIAVYCNVALTFIGMGVASAAGGHLRPRFMDRMAPRALDGLLDRLTDLGFALFSIAAAWLCVRLVQETAGLQETDPVLQWEVWPFQLFMLAAFGMAAVRHGLYATYPLLRPRPHSGGDDAPPTEAQVREFAPPGAETPASGRPS